MHGFESGRGNRRIRSFCRSYPGLFRLKDLLQGLFRSFTHCRTVLEVGNIGHICFIFLTVENAGHHNGKYAMKPTQVKQFSNRLKEKKK